MEVNPFNVLEDHIMGLKGLFDQLSQKIENISPAINHNDLVGVHEAAKFLKRKPQTLYAMVSEGKIPHMKVEKQLWFSLNELDEWIRSKKVKTNEDYSTEADDYLKKEKKG